MHRNYTFAIGLRRRPDSRTNLDSSGPGDLLGWPHGTILVIVSGILQVFQIDGFTLRHVHGMWKGVEEPSIEVSVTADLSDADIHQLVRMFALQFDQESVGVQTSNPFTFISA